MPNLIDFDLSPRQVVAWEALANPAKREVLYGGARYGGKTVLLCRWSFVRAVEVAKFCQIGPRKYPIPVGFLGRRVGTDFRTTTLETWKKFIPENLYEIRVQDKEIIIPRAGVKLHYGGLDSPEVIGRFGGAEYAFVAIDQAEELDAEHFRQLRATCYGRFQFNKRRPAFKMLWSANPAQCYLKTQFIDKCPPDHAFVRALPSDNPWLAPSYIDGLMKEQEYRPEVLRAWIEGSWEGLAGGKIAIQEAWVRAAFGRPTVLGPYSRPRKVISVDPAREGSDRCVMMYLEETEVMRRRVHGTENPTMTAHEVANWHRDYEVDVIMIDTTGVGAGCADRLREMNLKNVNVMDVNFQSGARFHPEQYVNKRAEMWLMAGNLFGDGKVSIKYPWPELMKELSTPQYEQRGPRLIIESKDIIRKKLGQSPDLGDCYVLGLYGLGFCHERPVVKPIEEIDVAQVIAALGDEPRKVYG